LAELEPPLPRKERRAHKRPLPLPQVNFVPAGNPSLPTFVSLMLMITTFMIVLTSISLHENTRMRALMSSVRDAFAGVPGATSAGTEAAAKEQLLGQVVSGFKTAVPLANVDAAAGGDRLELTLPLTAALDTATGDVTAEFHAGMKAMAAALGKKPADLDYDLEIRFDDGALGSAHAAALAAAAMQGGIAPSHLSLAIGLVKADLESAHNLAVLVKLDPVAPPPGTPAVAAPTPADPPVNPAVDPAVDSVGAP
jgi:hypothetical protein